MDTGLATPESHVRDLHDHPLSGRKKGASAETPWGCSSGSVRWSITMSDTRNMTMDPSAALTSRKSSWRGGMTQRGRSSASAAERGSNVRPLFRPRERLNPCIQAIYPGREHTLFGVEDSCSCRAFRDLVATSEPEGRNPEVLSPTWIYSEQAVFSIT